MLFNSFEFVILIFATIILYYIPKFRNFQKIILILASFAFYAYNNFYLLILLVVSIAINAITSYLIEYGSLKRSRLYATSGIMANLAVLVFFKYGPLFSKTFFSPGDTIGEFLISIPLPIGISFFIFQGISLVIDTFKSDNAEEFNKIVKKKISTHGLNTYLFISFFPQLIAGPIVKAHDFVPQIKRKYINDIDWEFCFRAIAIGYFLKLVVADNLKDQTYWVEYPYFEGLPSSVLVAMLFGYSIQIFADFAGYSSIAIGIAGLFGYRLKENFNFPYLSTSFSEFWKRWHISLSSFLKEYLYIPLGGNRKGNIRTYLNLMIVMFLGGLWHGAAWSYAVWGTFHGFALAVEKFINKNRFNFPYLNCFLRPGNLSKDLISIFFVFSFVSLAWLLFKLPKLEYAVLYLESICRNQIIPHGNINLAIIGLIFVYSLPVILYHAYYLLRENGRLKTLADFEYLVFGIMIFLIVTNSGFAGSFIYFQF